ncbi:4-hydroxythreonine-4-phosphate dehydrogenase PdxA [Microvirga puerhi]|uniref:4-hydroxythreonine-4-phosphate dehydrogenase PdxA n=1 Tax=Microvirga puerhi TaxID=2876078 RepID=A0ABS7VI18_9HYPH|nr:4-hydroxythreonine-4-phosphate dehydrogenase PdxA [Microvirga puerhi]MBZ6075137.1 4-hydroxythreonine-4-phosphate dehydrogenase PdxA [Microvirga puerhi]
MGDPAGISPELAAKLIASEEFRADANLVVYGDRRILEEGARVAGVQIDVDVASSDDVIPESPRRPIFVDLGNLALEQVVPATATLEGGQFATANFRHALLLAASGRADGVFFTPFNKKAMRLAYEGYDDEIRFVRDVLKSSADASEFNVLGRLWNARVTSHIPLSKVASAISERSILRALTLADGCMRAAGFNPPRIAVAGLNPHAGDGGNFGREEIDVIEPAVLKAAEQGLAVQGPFPSDTVFLRAKNGDFDAVLTMYHDQGQIAMKLMGFDRGVTLIGGFPFPICTPAHGTAYEIAGRGIANLGASQEALRLAIRMGSEVRARRQSTGGPRNQLEGVA